MSRRFRRYTQIRIGDFANPPAVRLHVSSTHMRLTEWLKRLIREKNSATEENPSSAEIELDSLDPFDPFPEPVEIEIKDVIDLHTIPPREVQAVVQEYLLQAHARGFSTVRIIHGKGIGVQREMVRSILARNTFVFDWTDAPPEAGGLGATIVRFKESRGATDVADAPRVE